MIRRSPRLALALFLAAASAVAQRGAPIPQQLAFAPYHSSGIYEIGETVGWTVTPGPDAITYSYKWTVRRNNAVVLKEGRLDLSSGQDKIEIRGDQPEMIYVAIEPVAKLAADDAAPAPAATTPAVANAPAGGRGNPSPFTGGNTGRNNGLYAVGAAVAPTKIGLVTPRPADFDSFWAGKLAAQAEVPINPRLTPVEADTPGVEMNTFVLDALGSKTQGYVAKPAREGKFPALVLLQYAGVYALNAHADAARAAEGWLVINVDSHDKLPSDPSGNIPRGYQAVGNTDRENFLFPEHVSARFARPGLSVHAAGLGWQDHGPDGNQHGRPAKPRCWRVCGQRRFRRCWCASPPAPTPTAISTAGKRAIRTGLRTIRR